MTENQAEKARLPQGTRVRVTERSQCGDPMIDNEAAVPNVEYDIEIFVEGSEGDDPGGRAYYLMDSDGSAGGCYWAYPEHVTVVRTAAQQASRRPPSLSGVRAALASALHGMDRAVDVDETQHEGADAVLVIGSTDDGLRVSFRVRIDQIEEVDW